MDWTSLNGFNLLKMDGFDLNLTTLVSNGKFDLL